MSGLLYQAAIFFGSIVLVSISSYVLTVVLERIGTGLRVTGGLLGVMTALGADSPEISSSITALMAGHHELGVGVVLGSNIFNLAALLGLSALVAGLVRVRNAGAILNGAVALLTTAVAALLLLKVVAPWLGLLLIFLLIAPYIWVVALSPSQIERGPLPSAVARVLALTVKHAQKNARRDPAPEPKLDDWFTLLPVLFAIIVGSRGIVSSTLRLSDHFGIAHAIAGMLGIAALTGIPNAIAAVRLATRGRGAAVETECFNSNTLNLVFGICLPAMIAGLGNPSGRAFFALGWLGVMTILSIGLLTLGAGMRRRGGGIVVGCYLVFIAAIVCWPWIPG
jgi:cation:H+ antiporter